jgi:hypothetical protein
MEKRPSRSIIPSQGGLWSDFALRLKLIGRLMLDRRVSFLIKLLPLGSLVYFIAPDLFPGPIDDALLTWIGASLFLELCPSNIVAEHVEDLTSNESILENARAPKADPSDDVVEGEVIDSDK